MRARFRPAARVAALVLSAGVAGCGPGERTVAAPARATTVAVVAETATATPVITPTATAAPTPTPQAARRVPLRELAGQLVVTAVRRQRAPAPRLLKSIRQGLIGGVIVPDTSAADPRPVTHALQAAARAGKRPPVLVTIDQEGGAVRRLTDAQPVRSARQLGRGRVATTASVAQRAGCQMRRRGITLDLAPVADAATLTSGFIAASDRAFAGSSETAAPHVEAFVHGLHAGGVGATLKHFPGLGASSSTTDLTTLATSPDPGSVAAFARGIAAGADAVMVSSATYASGRFATGRPAIVSGSVLQRLRRLRFQGVVITDDLDAPGPRADPRLAGAAVQAVREGVDMLLYVEDTGAVAAHARESLVAAVRAGQLSRARLLDAYRRVTALKRALAAEAASARC